MVLSLWVSLPAGVGCAEDFRSGQDNAGAMLEQHPRLAFAYHDLAPRVKQRWSCHYGSPCPLEWGAQRISDRVRITQVPCSNSTHDLPSPTMILRHVSNRDGPVIMGLLARWSGVRRGFPIGSG